MKASPEGEGVLDSPKVSIVMPVFNGGDYFQLALQSAVSQTYRNIEIIVVDDGSEDNGRAAEMCHVQMERTDAEIVYIRQENAGVGAALNTGISAMSGDIFCWLSHDDLFYPRKLEMQVAYWRRLNRVDAILISDYDIVDEEGRVRNTIRLDHSAAVSSPRLPLFAGWINGCTIFAPVKVLAGSSTFESSYRYVQDYRLWLKLVRDHEFFHQPEVLVAYRVHSSQDSLKSDALKEAENFWVDAIAELSAAERSQLFGSTWRFFDASWRYLKGASYEKAAAVALASRETSLPETLVSVILPVAADEEAALRSLTSVLAQSHPNLEIILVGEELDGKLASAAASDLRIRRVQRPTTGLHDELNAGLAVSRGEYVCPLLLGDEFLSERIERQLETLQLSGSVFGYTSFFSRYRVEDGGPRLVTAGLPSGVVDPRQLEEHPLSTMMFHRLLLAEGFAFPKSGDRANGTPAWTDVSTRRPIFGLDDPLVIVGNPVAASRQGGQAVPIELRPRLRFDPDTHLSLRRSEALRAPHKLVLDLAAAENNYRWSPRVTPSIAEACSGLTPWDYVATVSLRRRNIKNGYVQLIIEEVYEDLYVLLVNEEFKAVSERLTVSLGKSMHDLWFEFSEEAFAVVVQAGANPAAAMFKISNATIYWRE